MTVHCVHWRRNGAAIASSPFSFVLGHVSRAVPHIFPGSLSPAYRGSRAGAPRYPFRRRLWLFSPFRHGRDVSDYLCHSGRLTRSPPLPFDRALVDYDEKGGFGVEGLNQPFWRVSWHHAWMLPCQVVCLCVRDSSVILEVNGSDYPRLCFGRFGYLPGKRLWGGWVTCHRIK